MLSATPLGCCTHHIPRSKQLRSSHGSWVLLPHTCVSHSLPHTFLCHVTLTSLLQSGCVPAMVPPLHQAAAAAGRTTTTSTQTGRIMRQAAAATPAPSVSVVLGFRAWGEVKQFLHLDQTCSAAAAPSVSLVRGLGWSVYIEGCSNPQVNRLQERHEP